MALLTRPRPAAFLVDLGLIVALSCGPPPGVDVAETAPAAVRYEPASDPLVNPPSVFEPFPVHTPELAARNDTLIVHALSEPESLNPLFATNGASLNLIAMLYGQLVVKNVDLVYSWNDRLIVDVDERGDGREVRIELRPEARWHDAEPLVARDVEFSWEAVMDPQVPASYWKGRAERLASVRATGPRTVLIRFLSEPLAEQLRLQSLATPIVPAHIFDRPDQRADDPTLRSSAYYNRFAREVAVGNGPFRFVEWLPNDRVVLERWPDDPQPPVYASFRQVIHKLVPDRNLALLEFLTERLDAMYLTAQQAATQTQGEEFERVGRKAIVEQQTHAHLRYNLTDRVPLFHDPRVRIALAHTLDVERLIDRVSYGLHRRAVGFLDGNSRFADPELEPYAFDLDRAAQLFDEAGWRVSEDDGWRYSEIAGRPTRMSFEVATFQAFRDFPLIADLWQDDLRRIGVEMRFRVYERGAFTTLRHSHEFEVIADYAGNAEDPDQWANHLASDAFERGMNSGGYSNPELDELFRRGRIEQDEAARLQIYRRAHALEHADPALLPIWSFRVVMGLHKRLRGIELSASGPYGLAGKAPAGWPSPIGPGWWVRADERLER